MTRNFSEKKLHLCFLYLLNSLEKYSLSFPDSIISTHAIVNKLKLATLDRDFKKVSELEVLGIE